MSRKFQWIAEDIDVTAIYQRLPRYVQEMIADIEQADLNDNMPVYYGYCDDLEIHTKLLVPDVISRHEWDLLCSKYSLPA